MKTRLYQLLGLICVLSVLLSACGSAPAPEMPAAPADAAVPEVTDAPKQTPKFKFSLVTPNPRGDHSFIDASVVGAEKAMTELSVEGSIIESQGVADQESALRSAISMDNDIVLALAIEPDTLISLANEYPDQKFGVPSELYVETTPDNVSAFQINVHQGAFLGGLVAGSLTKTKTVGAVVGGDSNGLNQFFYAYKQGVLQVCPDCKVLVSYLNFDFGNPTLGKETALGQFAQGADIIFQVAGRSGEGVISAAKEKGLYAIGVDSNQDDIAPGNVIVSVMKRVDITTYLLVKNTMEGNFKSGFNNVDMKDGVVGLSWDVGSKTFADKGPAEMAAKLPEIQKLVEEYRTKILNNEFEVCDAMNQTAVCDALK
ncbi:MAG: BMP family ABC transporter substrate-binding protein [Anaerolineaceae bacterium]